MINEDIDIEDTTNEEKAELIKAILESADHNTESENEFAGFMEEVDSFVAGFEVVYDEDSIKK